MQSEISLFQAEIYEGSIVNIEMMSDNLLLTNIKQLLQVREPSSAITIKGTAMKELPRIDNAYLLVLEGKISAFGKMEELDPEAHSNVKNIIDTTDRIVLPAWCDSHSHIVYAGSREQEFADRINGLSYQEIAARGGGILNSSRKLKSASEEELIKETLSRINEVIKTGTGALEIKSGYGLNTEAELKMLRVIKHLKHSTPLTIKATFLGAHAIPEEYKSNRRGYIDLLLNEMLPKIGEEKLADYCDVFCEEAYFTPDETIEILETAKRYGMQAKVHANQLAKSGGVQAGVRCGAISVDHLEYVFEEEIQALKNSETMPTLLPGAAFFLNLPLPPARTMLEAGLPIAIASDYNPGSSPSGSIPFMLSLACIQLKMTPEEVINAATINSAYAMGLSVSHGSISIGKQANLIITKPIPSYNYIPYAFNSEHIGKTILSGKVVYES